MTKRFHSADLATLDNSMRAAWFSTSNTPFPLSHGLFVSAKLKKQLTRTLHKQDSLLGNLQRADYSNLEKRAQQHIAESAVANGFKVAFLPFSQQSFPFSQSEPANQ
jgi:hypothetical protein